jgi:hypothetical protein
MIGEEEVEEDIVLLLLMRVGDFLIHFLIIDGSDTVEN